jgi:hypothetical protein
VGSDGPPSWDVGESFAEDYEDAERSFLDLVRAGADRGALAAAAAAPANAARSWQSVAYRHFFALRSAEGETDRDVIQAEIAAEQCEVLADLWEDLAGAFRGRTSTVTPRAPCPWQRSRAMPDLTDSRPGK